jgi:hypothetical protein
MALLGYNGGLRGKPRIPTPTSTSGIWDLDEQKIAASAGIWPGPVAPDPYWANVTRLYYFSSGPITDASLSESDPALVNDVQIVNDQSPFAGGSSAYFNGTSSYMDIPTVTLGTSTNFTVEFWIRLEVSNKMHTVLVGNPISNSRILFDGGNKLITTIYQEGPIIPTGDWCHVAFVREADISKRFINGVGSWFDFESVARTYNSIGSSFFDGSGSWWLQGWLSNMRITSGVARYSSDFTPPTAPFPNF